MVEGGKYNILDIISSYLDNNTNIRFTVKEIAEQQPDFCIQSIRSNITRLVKSGFLIKHEYYSKSRKCFVVDYTINPEALTIIKELFD